MLVQVVSGGVVALEIVEKEVEVPLLFSLHGWLTLGVIGFVSVRLSLHVTRFWDWASLGFLDSCK